jgi:hypothetical protein
MNLLDHISCRHATNTLCLQTTLNLSFDNSSHAHLHRSRVTSLLRLAHDSSSTWTIILILFLFITCHFIIEYFDRQRYFHEHYRIYTEIIDFTDDNDYQMLVNEQFQVRYGTRAWLRQDKPYHLYRQTIEQ